ncbi:MAG: hypothetical protein GX802_04225 [Clostridiales bacterium]|nr:hypothetical protein [Clostridiales bacterium]
MNKKLISLIIVAILLLTSSNALALGGESYDEVSFELGKSLNPPTKLNGLPYGSSFFEQLNSFERTVFYARLENLDAFRNGVEDEIFFDVPANTKAEDLAVAFFNACYAFDFDHPEIFWLSKTMRLGYYSNSSGTVSRAFFKKPDTGWYNTAYSSKNQIVNAEAAFNAKVNEIVSAAKGKDYDKVLYFHNWLVENNQYNRFVYEGNIDGASQLAWSAASALIGNSNDTKDDPVCEGYARAFKVLCDKAGIISALVSGSVGELHMWNAVKMPNDLWFALDATFDDPISQSPVLSHKYFLKGSKFMSRTHTENGSITTYGTYAFPELCENDYPMNAGANLGDVNLDNKINTGDAVSILLYVVGEQNLIGEAKICADFNCDTMINTGDAVLILKYATN